MSAPEIIRHFALEPLPQEGGYFRRIYTHEQTLPQREQAIASAILFLITGEQFSALHRLPADELFHFYQGYPAEMTQLTPEGKIHSYRLGHQHLSGESPSVCVPANHWQGMRLANGAPPDAYAFFGVSVHPEFLWDEFELGQRESLIRDYPEARKEITRLTRS